MHGIGSAYLQMQYINFDDFLNLISIIYSIALQNSSLTLQEKDRFLKKKIYVQYL